MAAAKPSRATLMSTQNSDNVEITGGTISGVVQGDYLYAPADYRIVDYGGPGRMEDVAGLNEETLAAGTYAFTVKLRSLVDNPAAGIQYGFYYVNPPSSLDSIARGYTDAGGMVSMQTSSDTTSKAALFSLADAVTYCEITGSFVLPQPSEIAVQVGQITQTSDGSGITVFAGATAQFTRIG